MIVNERQREMGLLRSMGAKKSTVFFSLIIIEAVIISLLGGIIGVAAGLGVLSSLKESIMAAFKLPYIWPGNIFIVAAAVLTLVVSSVTGIIAALYPAFRGSRMEPYDAIRKGE